VSCKAPTHTAKPKKLILLNILIFCIRKMDDNVCKKCTEKCPEILTLLDNFGMCYYCDYTEEERRFSDSLMKTKKRPAFVTRLSTILEEKCYCGEKSCDGGCGVLSCGCIDCCRCGAGLHY